jgi:predicted SprT family Zn-dependent metalloprotease
MPIVYDPPICSEAKIECASYDTGFLALPGETTGEAAHEPQPTQKTYSLLLSAYNFLNARLFNSELPPSLITLQRKAKTYGFFAGGRFGSRDGVEIHDEIALNPSHFKKRTTEQSLSTLAHEMAHLWQHHFGKPSRGNYHNKEWAAKMRQIGLVPSNTGQPGGREVGQSVSHYIEHGGRFQEAYRELETRGFMPLYVDLWGSDESSKRREAKKNASKTKYTCPDCCTNAWAKPGVHLNCGDCNLLMIPEDGPFSAEFI